jgi:predicted transposase/invertase (TIGR01784 family)
VYIDPKNDFAFQYVFGRQENKDILISFLNAVLKMPPDEKLTDITIMETKLDKELLHEKSARLDIRAVTAAREQINIEIQLANQYNMEKRTLFYWSRMYTGQLQSGHDYRELRKTITINILNFNYINTERYHNIFHITEDHTGVLLTDVLEIHFLELTKLEKEYSPAQLDDPLVNWLLFLRGVQDEQVKEVLVMKEPAIGKAMTALDLINQDREARRLYEIREKARHDEVSLLNSAREEARAEGLTEGRVEGKYDKAVEVARAMLRRGIDVKDIADMTGLTVDEVIRIKGSN